MYTDDEEQDQTREPGMRGADPAVDQRMTMTAMNGSQPTPPGMRTMAAGGAMGGRFGGMGGGQMPQMPWQQGPQQGQPDWGSIIGRFQQRFAQHNPFIARLQGGPQGGPQQQPPAAGAPQPQPAPQGGAPGAQPAAPGGNPWADRIAQAAARFGGNRQPGGIMGGRGQY